jgi:DNA invertase Pin-like site-specific DNA recombinase
MATNTSKRTVVYIRSKKGEPYLYEQEQECRDLAAAKGWEVTDVLIEPQPTKFSQTGHRPAFEQLLVMLRERKVGFVIAHRSGFIRDAKDGARFLDAVDVAEAEVVFAEPTA